MEKNSYVGRIKEISERQTEKNKAITHFHGNMMIEGRLEVISHEGTNFVTQSRVILETENGEKILDFLGSVPKEYVGEKVKVETSYEEKNNITEVKHSIVGENVPALEGSLRVRYIPQTGYFGKGEILFGHAGGGMKKL